MGFRPLPGFLSSQCTDFKKWMYQTAWVSVPFRGFYLLNAAMNYILKVCNSFPSPSGVSIFSIRKRFNDNKNHFGFRPLPGFLSSQCFLQAITQHLCQSFRPLPGFLSSQLYVCMYVCEDICFRPLPGFLSSQFSRLHDSACRNCFRPLPGFLSSQ